MKRISILSPLLLALPLSFAACDVDKDDGAETGAASGDDENDDDVDDGDDDEPDQGGSSSAGSGEDPTDADDEPDDEDPGDETGDDGTDGDTDGSETDGEETDGEDTDDTGKIEDANGIAMLHGEIPPIDDGEGGSDTSGSGGDSGIPDDAVLVVLDGTGAATCKAPWNGPDCGGNWRISFTLLPEMQQPGTYDLFDEAMGSFSFADAPHPEGDCPWGGGSLGGTLVIESVDDEVVIGHIEDADAFDFDANVAFVAPRC